MVPKIKELLETSISTPPEVYLKLQEALEDPDSSFPDLEQIINSDPGLAARLLKIVNSPFYGLGTPVQSISHALSILGGDQLNMLVLSTGITHMFRGIPRDIVDMESFWKHSVACGLISKMIAQRKNETEFEQFYLAGMLHDIGSLVICNEISDKALQIFLESDSREQNVYEVEKELIGFDHAEMGGALLKEWRLPERVVEAVACHHHPEKAEKHPLFAMIVHVAETLTHRMNLAGGELVVSELVPDVLAEVGLGEDEIKLIEEEAGKNVNEVLNMFF